MTASTLVTHIQQAKHKDSCQRSACSLRHQQLYHLAAQFCQGLRHSKGALGELLKLKHTHGAVPDDGLGVSKSPLEGLQGVGANIQSLKASES